MSFFRCIYNRNRFLKSVCIELNVTQAGPSSPVVCSISSCNNTQLGIRIRPTSITSPFFADSQPSSPCHYRLTMTLNEKNNLNQSNNDSALSLGKTSPGQIQNRSNLSNGFISDGYYRNRWQGHSSSAGEQSDSRSGQSQFDFDSIKVRLLENITFIGTAVAVGIDLRARTNEYALYRRGVGQSFQDYCQNHLQHQHQPNGANIDQNNNNDINTATTGVKINPLARIWSAINGPLRQYSCYEHDSSLTTIRFCGSCLMCHHLFEKLFHVYLGPQTSTLPSSKSLSILNILPKDSSTVTKEDTISGRSTATSESSGVDSLDEPSNASECNDETVSAATSDVDGLYEADPVVSPYGSFPLSENNYATDSPQKEHFDSVSRVLEDCTAHSLTVAPSGEPKVEAKAEKEALKTSENVEPAESSMQAIWQKVSSEYVDLMNNKVAIRMMKQHRPNEAMDCWLDCNTSAIAFFNMGVAYESGRYTDLKNVSPDLDKAHDCYALAASMGHAQASYNLALFYLYGKGKIEEDFERGLDLLEGAALKGVVMAQTYCNQVRLELAKQEKEELEQQNKVAQSQEVCQQETSKLLSGSERRARYHGGQMSNSMFVGNLVKNHRLHPNHQLEKQQPAGAQIQQSCSQSLRRFNSAPDLTNFCKSMAVTSPSVTSAAL